MKIHVKFYYTGLSIYSLFQLFNISICSYAQTFFLQEQ